MTWPKQGKHSVYPLFGRGKVSLTRFLDRFSESLFHLTEQCYIMELNWKMVFSHFPTMNLRPLQRADGN